MPADMFVHLYTIPFASGNAEYWQYVCRYKFWMAEVLCGYNLHFPPGLLLDENRSHLRYKHEPWFIGMGFLHNAAGLRWKVLSNGWPDFLFRCLAFLPGSYWYRLPWQDRADLWFHWKIINGMMSMNNPITIAHHAQQGTMFFNRQGLYSKRRADDNCPVYVCSEQRRQSGMAGCS